MKKLLFTLGIAFTSYCSYAQNTFPLSGNAGIGTTNPIAPLDINSSNASGIHLSRLGADLGQIDFSGYDLNISSNVNNMRFSVPSGGPVYSFVGGNVGIGTTSPSSLLTVNGNSTTNGAFSILNGNSYFAWDFVRNGHDLQIGRRAAAAGSTFYNTMILDGNGNVGIGTTNPGQKLEVAGNLAVTGTNGLILNTSGGGAIDNQTASLFLQKENGYPIIFRNTSPTYTEYMRINPAGNVGIGTQNPDEKLTVNGTVHSKEVKVDTSIPVPDYVFEPDYKLPTLSKIKAYVDENHHLPEIPSAKEIQKNGVHLGDMNMKLLKKIEELTLYLIEKDIRDKEKDVKLQSLQLQIDQLKKN